MNEPVGRFGSAQARPAPPHRVGHCADRRLLARPRGGAAPASSRVSRSRSRLQHLGHRNAGPLGDDLRDILRVHFLLEIAGLPLHLLQAASSWPRSRSSSGMRPYCSSAAFCRSPRRVARSTSVRNVSSSAFRPGSPEWRSSPPATAPSSPRSSRAARADLLLDRCSTALFGGLVLLLQQRLALDLELHHPALDFVDLLGQRCRSRSAAGSPPRPPDRSPCRAGTGRRCSGPRASRRPPARCR